MNTTIENIKFMADFLDLEVVFCNKVVTVLENSMLVIFNPSVNWNHLMQVVEKVESLENNRYAVEINQGHCNIYDMKEKEEIISIFNEDKKQSCYLALIDFIKL